ncbi:hypothetical protein BZM27_12840 [Paraburkholderia steynii]|uniref:PAAR domain-containing protein n=1 Tax=Paraburkholderia steynii TaxID=1245441 RepID=A0A4R0XP58_9BURK|nr:hypothetical protein BZM27_12840 [Paraburkholderia steynii]
MRRYDICNGDTTTAGGRVVAPERGDTIRGRAVAYEGDAVLCPKCDSTGRIVCTDRRSDTGPNGKQVALSGDWCVCKCDPSPRLIASQHHSGC